MTVPWHHQITWLHTTSVAALAIAAIAASGNLVTQTLVTGSPDGEEMVSLRTMSIHASSSI